MTAYRVAMHVRPTTFDAWVLDLPGCRTIGRDREESLALVPVVIAEYLAWLKSHGADVDPDGPAEFKVIEEVTSEHEFCFAADGEPLTSEDLDAVLRLTDFAAADLIAVYDRLPEVLRDWRPPESAVKIDNIYPDVRSIREMMAHATGSAGFFVRNLGSPDAWQPPDADPLDPDAVRLAANERLKDMSDDELSEVFRRPDTRRGGYSEWSARKVIRRVINHQRFHAKEIEQRLAWLLLVLPEVMPVSRE